MILCTGRTTAALPLAIRQTKVKKERTCRRERFATVHRRSIRHSFRGIGDTDLRDIATRQQSDPTKERRDYLRFANNRAVESPGLSNGFQIDVADAARPLIFATCLLDSHTLCIFIEARLLRHCVRACFAFEVRISPRFRTGKNPRRRDPLCTSSSRGEHPRY